MNAVQFELRRGTVADAATVAALSVQVFLDTYASEGVRPDLAQEAFAEYAVEAFRQRLGEPGRLFFLAERGVGLLGYAELLVSALAAPAVGVRGAELVRLYLQPAAQKRGVGRALITHAERCALEAGLASVWLTAWDGNSNARGFYERMGYADVGATTYRLQGNEYANRVFAKHL